VFGEFLIRRKQMKDSYWMILMYTGIVLAAIGPAIYNYRKKNKKGKEKEDS
jgi:hypothetical protein